MEPDEHPVHRGIGIALSPEDEAVVGDESLPAAHRARHLLDVVTRDGHEPLGQHWTTDRDRAEFFSGKYRGSPGPAWEVMFHATHPEPHEIITDPGWREEHEVNDSEDEVPVHPRAEMELTGVSWKPRGGEWTRHQLDEPEYHRAGTSDTARTGAAAGGELIGHFEAGLEATAINGAQLPESDDMFMTPHGKSPVAEHAERIIEARSALPREMYHDMPGTERRAQYPHPFIGAPHHGPYYVTRDPEHEHGDTAAARERQAHYHVVDRNGLSVHPFGMAHRGDIGMFSGWHGAMDDWHRLTHREEPQDIRYGQNGQERNPTAVDSVAMNERYKAHLQANPPQFPHSRVDPYAREIAGRPDAREFAPEGHSPSEEWHGPYETVRHPQTGRFHVIDNAGRHASDSRGYDTQMQAEHARDYTDRDRRVKEQGKAFAEGLFGKTQDVIDPGGTEESRQSDRALNNAQELMTRYEGGRGQVKFDDEEDGGEPYYELEHHHPNGVGSGWYARHYGGPNVSIYHRATGDDAHDSIGLATDNREGKLVEPYGEHDLERDLRNWHDQEGGTRDYFENDQYGRQSEPRIHRWKQRHVGAIQAQAQMRHEDMSQELIWHMEDSHGFGPSGAEEEGGDPD